MLYYKNNQWNMSEQKVKYTQNKETIEQFVGQEGKEWWLEFVKLHKDTKIIEFIDVIPTTEQIARLEEVNQLNISDGHSGILSDYVIRNTFPLEVNHILKDLQNSKRNYELEDELASVWFDNIVKDVKINDNGQEIADLWFEVIGGVI